MFELPRLYAIADAETLRRLGVGLREFAEGLRAGGVELVQWRAKGLEPQEVLEGAAVLRGVFAAGRMGRLIMNDRVDLALIAGFDGVHLGQEDLGVLETRRVVGADSRDSPAKGWTMPKTEFLVGVSTHTEQQARAAEESSADYLAVGPVFATATKADAAGVVGLEGVRRARQLTAKPLVAIGGITRENCRSVVDAGADSVAVISGLLGAGESVADVVRDFRAILG